MRARKILKTRWLSLFLGLSLLISSCTGSDTVVTSNDYCYIKSVLLGTVKRQIERRDQQGNVSKINTTVTGSNYAMTINQRDNTIENRDSLPFGCQLSAVLATITFDGSLMKYRVKGSNSEWTAYNSTDSLDLTMPLEFYLTSNDNLSSRTYTFKVNVHQQEGDSLYWKQCEKEVAPLADMTDMKAFVMNDKLMVLGRKASGIVIAERSGIEAQGTWEETPVVDLPLTTDLQTLRQHKDTYYLSTTDGIILSSLDAKTWQQEGTPYTTTLTLVEKTDKFYYALSEGNLLRSEDAVTWYEDALDTEPSKLPVADVRALTLQQTNGNTRIVMVGQSDGEGEEYKYALVWNKMWNESETEDDAVWMYFPLTSDNKIPCPRLQYLNLLPYDGKCMAFGGASVDGTHKALDAMYVSYDYGITWRPTTDIHLPVELVGTEGCITSAVDKNYFIWIITNAQIWRGRLNRLGFAQQ